MILSLWVLLLTVCSWPQPSSTNKTEKAAIRRAKSLIVSSFDRGLPNVSLEFFLKNEGGGAPIKWEVNDCGEQNGDPTTDDRRDPPMCVEADFEAKNLASVSVLVSVGTLKGAVGRSSVPEGDNYRPDRDQPSRTSPGRFAHGVASPGTQTSTRPN